MNTLITIKAHSRPGYFSQVVRSLQYLSGIENYEILVSLDYVEGPAQEAHIYAIRQCDNMNSYHVLKNAETKGCAGNTKLVLEHAFSEGGISRVIHLEDDTVPAKDYLQYMEWGLDCLEKDNSLFAVCPFNRIARADVIPPNPTPQTSFLRPWFECGGGFGITRSTWDFIQSKGGMFGVEGACNTPDLVGLAWRFSHGIKITDQGSWAWPWNQYFRERSETEHLCIFPTIGRTNNIGAKAGRFNPNPTWHQENIWDPNWIGAEKYEDLDLEEMEYTWHPSCIQEV